jgi:isoleucyl-tRNA synthetase
VAKALEEKRASGLIGSSFDAQIILLTNSQIRYKYLESLQNSLCEIFKVSGVRVELKGDLKPAGPSGICVTVEKADGAKCARCWNYSISVGKCAGHPLICDNCLKAISEEKKIEEKAQ